MHTKNVIRMKKIEKLSQVAAKAQIIGLQEVHGTEQKLRKALHSLLQNFLLFFNPGEHSGTAGTAFLVSKEIAAQEADVLPTRVVHGRVLLIAIRHGDYCSEYVDIHNFELSPDDIAKTHAVLRQMSQRANEDPEHYTGWAMGDFNFLAPAEVPFFIHTPDKKLIGHAAIVTHQPAVKKWQRVLGQLTELQQSSPTYFSVHTTTMQRYDRIYTTMPPWELTMVQAHAQLHEGPKLLQSRGISDHSPVLVSLTLARQLPADERPIPAHIFKLPDFKREHDRPADIARLEALPPFERLRQHKLIIKEAARIARDNALHAEDRSAGMESMALSTLARTVWHNNTKDARKLLSLHPTTAEHIRVVDSVVELVDPVNFAKVVAETKSDYLKKEKEDLLKDKAKGFKNASRIQANKRLLKLWSPFDSRMTLAGVRIHYDEKGSYEVVTDPARRVEALRQAWQPVFDEKAIDEDLALHTARTWCRDFGFDQCPPPDEAVFAEIINRAKNSSPGPDGIPFIAYKASGPRATKTLFLTGLEIASGVAPPIPYNDAIQIFAPKGEDELDSELVSRAPADTRPLALKNSDNKVIAGAYNWAVRRQVSKKANHLQRGFIVDRQLLDNVIDLDSHARIAGMLHPDDFPAVALFDFAAAFPSLAHKWIFLAIYFCGFPAGFIAIVEANYSLVFMFIALGGQLHMLLLVAAGVLQGCPLSGTLFAVCVDPFLRQIDMEIVAPKHAEVRACADDIGASLTSIGILKILFPVFRLAQAIAGLTLKPQKCILIPVFAKFSDDIMKFFKTWLQDNIPEWSAFNIRPVGKYLGFWLGPAASQAKVWEPAAKKWQARSKALSKTEAAATVLGPLYSSRALSTIGYVAQIVPPTKEMLQAERAGIHALLKLPHNTFDTAASHSLMAIGGPKIPAILAMTIGARYRAAKVTLKSWKPWIQKIKDAASEALPWIQRTRGVFWPSYWECKPFVFFVEEADGAFQKQPAVYDAITTLSLNKQFANIQVQSAVTNAVAEVLHTCDWPKIFRRRIPAIVPELRGGLDDIDWASFIKALKHLKGQVALSAVKTLLNGWTTSARFHEPVVLSCVLGCTEAGSDNLMHYMRCSRMRRLLIGATQRVPCRAMKYRLGLVAQPAQLDNIRLLAVMFDIYHTLRHHRAKLEQMPLAEYAAFAKEVAEAAAVAVGLR